MRSSVERPAREDVVARITDDVDSFDDDTDDVVARLPSNPSTLHQITDHSESNPSFSHDHTHSSFRAGGTAHEPQANPASLRQHTSASRSDATTDADGIVQVTDHMQPNPPLAPKDARPSFKALHEPDHSPKLIDDVQPYPASSLAKAPKADKHNNPHVAETHGLYVTDEIEPNPTAIVQHTPNSRHTNATEQNFHDIVDEIEPNPTAIVQHTPNSHHTNATEDIVDEIEPNPAYAQPKRPSFFEIVEGDEEFSDAIGEIDPPLMAPEEAILEFVDLYAEGETRRRNLPKPLSIDHVLRDAENNGSDYCATHEGYGWYFKENGGGYRGYDPISPRDLQQQTQPANDLSTPLAKINVENINPALLRDNAKTSKTLLIFIVILSLALLTLSIWQVLIANCLVTELCEANDRSTDLGTAYLFKTFDFRVPTSFVWANLLGGTFGMLLASILAFLVLRRPVGSAKMVQASTIMRKASILFLGQQSLAFFIPFVMFFTLFGATVNWETAGSFGIGVLLSVATGFISRTMGYRGSVRASAATHSGIEQGIRLSFRVAAVVSLSILGISLFGISSVYLMFSDVRALGGFAAGAATSALFLRLSGCLFGVSLHAHEAEKKMEQSRPGMKTIGDLLAACVQRSSVIGPDWFDANVSCITATAILASSLPFFHRDSFAMCIYNHLGIDEECGPFGKTQDLSYAVYICRNDNLYLTYPNLPTWSSNSAFVAVPFLLAAVGLLTSIICAMLARFKDVGPKGSPIRSFYLRKRLIINAFVGCAILVACFAAICFGLFGPSSSFRAQKGFGSETDLQRMVLDDSENACLERSLNIRDLNSPLPLPSGGQMKADKYRPVAASGRSL
ncbi:unnamed protein product, partial [Agarophyton chilense]